MFGDSDDESEPFEGFNVDDSFKMLDNFENKGLQDTSIIFDSYS